MSDSWTGKTILKALDWSYEKAIDGFSGFDSASGLAEGYLGQDGTLVEQVNALIRWQNTKAATTGFLTGL